MAAAPEGVKIICGNKNFELICTAEANGGIPVHKYKSITTGITVIVAEVEGPVVNGYFVLATEAHDDDGLPHTLEHLIFLGSEKYPYKGVLDLLANRCLASGTNAWTDVDHTCYTLTTGGSEGFLTLLPIYLDHILYPTLTEAGYITEVHHVKGDGDDAGVVYCEMQGRENSGESRCHLALLRAMYPGECGYKSETGGILKNLRESTSIDKVRKYHKEFYRPDNLTVIVTGQVIPADVFDALKPVEEKILSKGSREPFVRPWESPVPPLLESVDLTVRYPCDEEDNGMVYVAWRGPSAVTELYEMVACTLFLKYMTDTAVSPLQKEFVEIDDPMASSVDFTLLENSVSTLYLIFENVPIKKIEQIKSQLNKLFSDLGDGKQRVKMRRMRTVIRRHALEVLVKVEKMPHDSVAYSLIGDMLYGHSLEDLDHRVNVVEDLRRMEHELEPFWVDLITKYFVNAPSVTVLGIPSIEEQRTVALENKIRVDAQKEALGEEGLKVKADILRKAIAQNEIPVPEEILRSVAIPSIDSIQFHKFSFYTPESDEQHPDFDLKDLPIQVYLDDIRTNFVHIHILMDTSEITEDMRQYLPLVMESLLELPVQRGDELVPYEEVVSQLENDTISVSTNLGVGDYSRFKCGPYSHTAVLKMQVDPRKYERGMIWVKELLYKTRFTAERLRVIASKMVNDVAQVRRSGSRVVSDLMRGLRFKNNSNQYYSSMLRQSKFLTSLIERLETKDGEEEILKDVETLRNILIRPYNLAAHVAFDVTRSTYEHGFDPEDSWLDLIPEITAKRKPLNVTTDSSLTLLPNEVPYSSCVVGLGCVDSSFLCRTTPCVNDYKHEDLAALLLFIQYLTQLEGPMWKQIRGLGLSYGYSIRPQPNEGLLYLTLSKATRCVEAYEEAKKIACSHIGENVKWDQALFESARSSLIFEIIEREKSIDCVVMQSLLSYFRNTTHDYNSYMIEVIASTELSDLAQIGQKYIAPLFDPEHSKTTIVCHPSAAHKIAEGFKRLGEELTVYQNLEESFLNN